MRATRQPGSLVALVGAPGTGKTALLYYFVNQLRQGNQPYFLISDAKGFYRSDDESTHLAKSASELHGAVVVVDDADALLVTELRDIVETAVDAGASVVVSTSSHALLKEITIPPGEKVIELGDLSRSEIMELLRSRFPSEELPEELVQYAYSLSGSPRDVLQSLNRFVNERVPAPMLRTILEPLEVVVELGEATAEDLADLMVALSNCYRAVGGRGLDFGEPNVSVFLPEFAA
jgi:GTPase SAR1 family protein